MSDPRVLVVEDDLELSAQICAHLRAIGCEVICWTEGHHIVEDMPPDVDLIVLDLGLPRVPGTVVLQELRKASDTPVLVLSARQETTDKVEALRLGADDYLTKPFSREELLNAVRSRLERAEALRAGGGGGAFDFSSPEPLQTRLGITPREAEVLLWVAQGKSNADIGGILGMAEKTVKTHLGNLFTKLGIEGRNAATVLALEVLSGRR